MSYEIIQQIKESLAALKSFPLNERVEIFNEVSKALKNFLEIPHPVMGVQLIPSENVVGNEYNPNKVAPPEMRLLKLSILKDGVTMPIVAAADPQDGKYIVVDGFHRTSIIKSTPEISDSLGGYIPLVQLNKSIEDRMASTVRHNMARGTHQVELSAKLVTALTKHHWTKTRISMELGMDPDEVLRLKQITGLAEAFRYREFSKAWQ